MNIKNIILLVSLSWAQAGYGQSTDYNYVGTSLIKQPNITTQAGVDALSPLTGKNGQRAFFDGLGRPLQQVAIAATPSGQDLITPVEFDGYGRQIKQFLPYTDQQISGGLRPNAYAEQRAFYNATNAQAMGIAADDYPFVQTHLEFSPMSRPVAQGNAGETWQPGNGHTVKSLSSLNTSVDAVRIWNVTNSAPGFFGSYATSGTYAARELYKTISVDEHSKQVIEFKDKEGKVILKKVQISSIADDGTGRNHIGWLCTYYIYDDLNNLRCVIQPEAVKRMSDPPTPNWDLGPYLYEQCFRYEYDHRNRMTIKKVPGAEHVDMIYDARDRLVMTQDGIQRQSVPIKWGYTEYDVLNRPVATGIFEWNTDAQNFRNFATVRVGYPWNIFASEGIIPEVLTNTYYDNYIFPAGPFANAGYDNTWNGNLLTPTTSWPYPQANIKSNATKGMVTGTRTKILGTPDYLYSANIYDEKGRLIQVKTTNITGGTDVITTQYSWAGLPLVVVQKQQKALGNPQDHIVVSKMTYDDLGRVLNVKKSISSTIGGSTITKPEQIILQNEYNALGQLKSKKLAPSYGSNGLQKLNYEYNIRGWLLGMNRDYTKDISAPSGVPEYYFGFDLGYDKQNNGLINNQAYAAPQYNGNITGTVWKSKGDGEKRRYDFAYDAVNRLLKGDFTQYKNGAFNQDAVVNYTMKMGDGINPGTAYDANGNIILMQQWGLKLTTSEKIDNLQYSYKENSNQLQKVFDNGTPVTDNGKLGDFKDGSNGYNIDYDYDVNGNLKSDLNKSISNISYNHLNLPQVITVTGKGTITYTYDAAGNKLKKVTLENASAGNANITTTTTTNYIGGFVYETKSDNNPNTTDYSDKLQFTGHEEGRIRAVYNNTVLPNTLTGFEYDYMIKDHLGNVRMMLTEEQNILPYPAATLEGTFSATGTAQANSMINTEKQFYNIDNTKVVLETAITSWPTETVANTKLYYNHNGNPPANSNYPAACTPVQTAGSTKLYKLNANANKTGLEFMIKVMAGDKIDIFGKSYHSNTTLINGNSIPLSTGALIASMLLSPANAAIAKGISAATLTSINNNLLNSFIRGNTDEQGVTTPKAYINYIFLDEQFKYAGGSASRVGSSGTVKDHWYQDAQLQNIPVPKNGYLFVYVSNESIFDVFFDNLQVIHKPGPILEETHYYPFGLTMAGISSKSAGTIQNKEKTFQGQRFDDDLGLNWVQFKWRNHDPQIGRFIEVDPLSDKYVYNSTYAFSENKVTAHVELEGLESSPINASVNPVAEFFLNKLIELVTDPIIGTINLEQGAIRKAEVITGANDNLPQPIQKLKSVSADLQIPAGVAQMVKPGMEMALMVGGATVGVEIPSAPGLVTGVPIPKPAFSLSPIAPFENINLIAANSSAQLSAMGQTPAGVAAMALPDGSAVSVATSGIKTTTIAPQWASAVKGLGGIGARANGNTVGACAEFNAGNQLLLANPGVKPSQLVASDVYRPRTSALVPTCPNCKILLSQ